MQSIKLSVRKDAVFARNFFSITRRLTVVSFEKSRDSVTFDNLADSVRSNIAPPQKNLDEGILERPLGALKSIPKLVPWHEFVGLATKKAKAIEADTTIRNSKIRACKLAATKLSTFSKELTMPLGAAVDGFKLASSGISRLHPFERTLATLTLRNMEREGHGTLDMAINAVKALRKDTSLCIKPHLQAGANAATAKEVRPPPPPRLRRARRSPQLPRARSAA